MRTLSWSSFAVVMVLALGAPAAAQDEDEPAPPPIAAATSGEASLNSGRTLGTGEVMVAGAAGWPYVYGQVELAPSNAFNLGIRAALLYGSPIMQLHPGVGGELSVPLRLHVHGEGDLDVAIYATGAFTFAEAAAVGEYGNVFGGSFGWGTRAEVGVVCGYRAMERFTILFGGGGHFGFVHTPDAGGPEAVGALMARFGVEGLISRDTMLFALADGGVGFAAERGTGNPVFGGPVSGLLRIALGVAYLL